jgi:tetratricopeptide (TPR) repeat protein
MDLPAAQECFDEVLASDPDNVEALTYRGWSVALASFRSGGGEDAIDEALGWIDQAIELDATYPDALAFRVVLLNRAGRTGELDAALTAFDAADPPPDMVALVDSIRTPSTTLPATPALACRQLIESDIVGSLRCFDEVLAEDPDDAEALAYRGWALVLTAFAAIDQDTPSLADELFVDALDFIERSLAEEPDYVDALVFAAIVLDELGRTDDADARLAQLFALDPPDSVIQRLESYIPDARERSAS